MPDYGWQVFSLVQYEDYIAPLSRIGKTLILLVVGISCAVAAVVLIYGHFMLRPIRMLTNTAHHIATSGQLDREVEWQSHDDVGNLAESFNLMLGRLRIAQKELIDERCKVENIIASMADLLFVTDKENRVVMVNKALCETLGRQECDLMGCHLLDIFVREQSPLHLAVDQDLFPGGELPSVGSVIIDRSKRRVFVSVSGALLQDTSGNVTGKVFVAKDITKLREAHVRLNHLANHDSLTGLPNRLLLTEKLGQMIERIPRHGRLVAVMFIDIDRFKLVNDTLGHSAGDKLIKVAAERLRESIRDDDMVARFGGDEFVVLLNDVAHIEDVLVIAEKILSVFAHQVDLEGNSYTPTASIGISTAPDQGEDAETLLKNADMAMYQAKWKGRDTFQIYSSDMHFDTRSVFHMEVAMRKALEQGEYAVFYQPVVDAATHQMVGIEALVRWIRKDGTLCSPGDFLPIAEETGLILPLGRWIMEQALDQVKRWHDMGHSCISLSLNISDRQFRAPKLVSVIRDVLRWSNYPAEKLNIELTEGILMMDLDRAIRILKNLKDLGALISIDDFGTGYSSFGHLKRFPLDILKIDKSFVMGLPDNKNDVAIAKAIIGLAHTLDLGVIAEGVETENQAALLKHQGADMLQGFLFSKPLPAGELEKFMKINNVRGREAG